MVRAVLVIATAFITTAVFAISDEEKYKLHAAEVRKEVWGWNKPEFQQRTVPAEYNNFSYVTIAKHLDISATSRTKFQFGMGSWFKKEYTYTRTIRELVKINDKAALEEYSELSYQQFKRRQSILETGTSTTIIGVRIVKPDGTVKEVNADEIVLTKDQKTNKQAKLAISDLQVGDMVDYFITTEDKMLDGKAPEASYFVFGEDNPIMHYSVHCLVGKKYAVEYRALNGAPEFKQSRGEDDDIVLDVAAKDIPAFPTTLWMSSMRQIPILRMNIIVGYNGMYAGRINARKPGEVYRNQPMSEIVEDEVIQMQMEKAQLRMGTSKSAFYDRVKTALKKVNKDYDKLPKDELASLIFYTFRFLTTYDVNSSENIEVGVSRNYANLYSKKYLFYLSEVFKDFDIRAELALVTSKYGPHLQEVMDKDDFEYIVVVKEGKPAYYGIENLFSPAGYIPAHYEGIDKAPSFNTGGNMSRSRKDFAETTSSIPASSWKENMQVERLQVKLDADNMQVLDVKRKTSNTGHFKIDDQKRLLLFEEYYESERKALGLEKSLVEELSEKRRTRSLSDEYKNAFAKAREDVKERFKSEIQSQFEIAPKELLEFKVDTIGIRHTEPAFVYSSHFTFDGLVKKAGNNYILDIGKFIGGQLQLKPWQRDRKVDVYMPFARAFDYVISVSLPDGYKAEGLDKLNLNVETAAGSFAVTTTAEGNQVNMFVRKIYAHAYEPVANWQNLVHVLDAAVDFNGAKLLIRKI